MSLIHEALKKAQENGKPPIGSGLGSFQGPLLGEKKPTPKRTIILAVGVLIALAFFAYTKFFPSKPEAPAAASPPGAASVAANGLQPIGIGEQDAGKLKKSGVDAFNSDDMDVAWNSFSAASQLAPKDPEAWNNLGLVARKRGDAAKAREFYDKALELKPDYPEALNNLAVLEMQSGNNARARELLEKAVKVSPAYPEANFHLGLLHDQKGEKEKAVEYYKRFLEVGKNFPSASVDSVRDRVMEIEP